MRIMARRSSPDLPPDLVKGKKTYLTQLLSREPTSQPRKERTTVIPFFNKSFPPGVQEEMEKFRGRSQVLKGPKYDGSIRVKAFICIMYMYQDT